MFDEPEFIEGFTKEAMAMGCDAEQTKGLLKLAVHNHLMATSQEYRQELEKNANLLKGLQLVGKGGLGVAKRIVTNPLAMLGLGAGATAVTPMALDYFSEANAAPPDTASKSDQDFYRSLANNRNLQPHERQAIMHQHMVESRKLDKDRMITAYGNDYRG